MNANEREYPAWSLARRVIGVFYTVYNELGPGFLESVYQEAMAWSLEEAGLAVARQVPVEVWFRNHSVGSFRADLIIGEGLLVELKAARAIENAHVAQVLNYLRATNLEAGLLLNFGHRPQFKRVVYDIWKEALQPPLICVHSRSFAASVAGPDRPSRAPSGNSIH